MSTRGIYGLSGSGIDVDSMVKVGMMTKQSQYDKMYKQEVKNEWLKEAYSDLYGDLNTFNTTTLSSYKMSSKTSPMLASSSASTVATATANADAASMSHTVNVSALASNAYLLTGEEKLTRANTSDSAKTSIYLKDMLFTEAQQTDLRNKLNADSTLGTQTLVSFNIADGTGANATSETISFTYNDIFSSGQTLNDLVSKINASGVNIKASFDNTNDAFSLYQKTGGEANKIILSVANDGSDASANGKTLLGNLNLHSVTNTTDANGNRTSTLSASEINLDAVTTGTSEVGGTQASYTSATKTTSDALLSTLFKAQDGSKSATFAVNGKTVTIDDVTTKKVSDLIDAINGSGAGVTASLASDGQLTVASNDNTAKVTFGVSSSATDAASANGRSLLNGLNFVSGKELTADTHGASTAGTSATATIDGKKYTSDTGKVTVGGVTYTLNAMGAATVSVSQDTDTLVKNVQSFVDDYNKMIDALNTKYYEKQYSDYGVLTKSQESAMTADQITKWNEKAKSGLLYHDQTLGKVISSMRQALYTPVDSVTSNYNTMMSIGITSSTDQGHIRLDTDKLKKALAADPDCVRQLFASSGDVTTTDADGKTKTTTDYNKEGVLNRISDALHTNLKTMKSYAGSSMETADGSTLGTLIENLKTKMSDFKTQMDAFENALYDKYDAMETAIQRLSMQLGYITGGN